MAKLLGQSPGMARHRRGRGAWRWRAGLAIAVLLAAGGGLVAAAFALSRVRLVGDAVALGRLKSGPLAGSLESVRAFTARGRSIPMVVHDGRLRPRPGVVAPGERVVVDAVVRRPGALSWLLGGQRRVRLVTAAPVAHVARRHLVVSRGSSVRVSFDRPVRAAEVDTAGGREVRHFSSPQRAVTLVGPGIAGSATVAAAPRAWERLGAPQQVTWLPRSRVGAAIASPPDGSRVSPTTPLRLTFSRPVDQALGTGEPPAPAGAAGHWSHPDPYTLAFVPAGPGAPLGAHLRVALPRPITLVDARGGERVVRSVTWSVRQGSTLRLQQLLAQAGYLPLDWRPAARPVPSTMSAQLSAAVRPPAGRFAWRYPNIPAPLRGLWSAGHPNDIVRGAIVAFESDHGLTADGFAGPQVWSALLHDTIGHRRHRGGYSYVYVHRDGSPQTLTLWHDGRTVLSSPANTGVAAAPTALGTYPVFEHLRVTTMSGTNPDGSHYSDPGIKYVSYFNGGDAIHAFDRASFGTPQSVGCVELPLANAARVWPYTPIGTLVTIEH